MTSGSGWLLRGSWFWESSCSALKTTLGNPGCAGWISVQNFPCPRVLNQHRPWMSQLSIMLLRVIKLTVIYILPYILPVVEFTLLLPQWVPRAEVQGQVQTQIKIWPEVGTIHFVTSQLNTESDHMAHPDCCSLPLKKYHLEWIQSLMAQIHEFWRSLVYWLNGRIGGRHLRIYFSGSPCCKSLSPKTPKLTTSLCLSSVCLP